MDTLPAKKSPVKPLSPREKNFCLSIQKGSNIEDAIRQAGYKMVGAVASSYGSRMLKDVRIKQELERLSIAIEQNTINDYIKPFKDEFINSMVALKDLRDNGSNDYVKLSAIKEYLDRVAPKVTRNESVKVTISKKELERRQKLVDAIDVTAI